jgi:hypothetical protein
MTKWIGQSLAVSTSVLLPGLALAQGSFDYGPPIVIMGMGFGMLVVLAVVVMGFFWGMRRNQQRLELIGRLVEKGHAVPPALFGKPLPPHEQQRVDVRRGITLLGWAIGVALLMYFGFGELRATAWALLFLFLSLASFVNAYLSGRFAREHTASDAP